MLVHNDVLSCCLKGSLNENKKVNTTIKVKAKKLNMRKKQPKLVSKL